MRPESLSKNQNPTPAPAGDSAAGLGVTPADASKIKIVEKERVWAEPRHIRMLVRVAGDIELAASWYYAWRCGKPVVIYAYEDEWSYGATVEEFNDLSELANSVMRLANTYIDEYCKNVKVEIQVADSDLYEILTNMLGEKNG